MILFPPREHIVERRPPSPKARFVETNLRVPKSRSHRAEVEAAMREGCVNSVRRSAADVFTWPAVALLPPEIVGARRRVGLSDPGPKVAAKSDFRR